MKIRHFVMGLLTLAFVHIPLAATGSGNLQLVVYTVDGSRTTYDLQQEPKVSFTDDAVVIETASSVYTYPIDITDKICYEGSQSHVVVGVDNIGADNNLHSPIVNTGDNLIVTCSAHDTLLSIYYSDGRLLMEREMKANTTESIPVAQFNTGVYLVRFNNLTHKIIIK